MPADSPEQSDWRPLIVAHRGLWKPRFPENSKAAFEWAREKAFSVVECDVWQSIDGEPIVIHDETLDRTTDAVGPVAAYSRVELGKVRLRHEGASTEWRLPSLSEVAHLVSLVEIKPCDARGLVRRVIDLMPERGWMLQSFDERNLGHALEYRPRTNVALLVEDPAMLEARLVEFPSIHLRRDLLDEDLMSHFRAAATQVGVWTVNTVADVRRLVSLRPDRVITDEPEMVLQTLREAGVAAADQWQWTA